MEAVATPKGQKDEPDSGKGNKIFFWERRKVDQNIPAKRWKLVWMAHM
jgi:hypothetical protein